MPGAISDRIDQAYRVARAPRGPGAADDDAFQRDSIITRAAWLLGNLAWLLEDALREDTKWGIATRRSCILHYLETALEPQVAEILPCLANAASGWRDQLGAQWPDSTPLALYPAFASL